MAERRPGRLRQIHLADDRILACVQLGVYLIADGASRLVALVSGPVARGQRVRVRVEAISPEPSIAQAFLADVSQAMQRLNVYRGHVISVSPGQFGMGPQTLIAFHHLPAITRKHVVLPGSILERIERYTVVFSQHAADLVAAGRSLKRGLLLFGPPGVGKTLTVMYLVGQLPGLP